MCGFAGAIAWDERYRVSRETLAKMSARIAHRGPDGQGVYFSPDAPITPDRPQIALAHRRLAILDPDPRANQPFTDKAGRWLVYNGEIYNFRELRAELAKLQPGYEWRTNCDTEVLLVAYDQWGEKSVEHFNGMFAFAIWDEPRKALFLARDRMGQKPLYVRSTDGAVYFASELNAVPKDGPPRIHPIWLGDYLRYGCLAGFTPWMFDSTCQLRPGDRTRYQNASDEALARYFDPGRIAPARVNDETAVRETRTRLSTAVERQLVSDVPLGVFLSGGVDSSIIAAIARKFGPVKTFSIRFDDPRYDESQYARQVAAHLGTEHHEFTVSPNAVEDLPTLAAMFGEPFGDSSSLPTHYLSRETRAHVKVALSGDGGDELFGGYDRYRAMLWSETFSILATIGNFNEKSGSRASFLLFHHLSKFFFSISKGMPKHPFTRLGRFIQSVGHPSSTRYDGFLRIFSDALLAKLCPETVFPFPVDKEAYDIQLQSGLDAVEAALACDRMRYLPDDLLTKVDRCSMLHALEVRSPFMDHELVEFAAGLTTDQLLKGGPKRMLREAFADDLPAWVFKRRKMGFAVPIGDWFRGELRPMLRDHLFAGDSFASAHFNRPVVERLVDEHESGRVDHSQRLYALLMLELWWKTTKSSG
ncbi:MAG TPA: asparagine synthase (glutamine-hydrolyzing) [Tepidisphaeraceae bacterium]|jgi:asparagine synthase (glutamine-hydrolysing)|nr:asparagine synthase (glutamine-hydrolyzing) [Tepidisphaeraceae bacterium]